MLLVLPLAAKVVIVPSGNLTLNSYLVAPEISPQVKLTLSPTTIFALLTAMYAQTGAGVGVGETEGDGTGEGVTPGVGVGRGDGWGDG